MVEIVFCEGLPLVTLWDPGSDMTIITYEMASKLGLKGKDISISITKVGNKTETFNSKEYNLSLTDKYGNLVDIKAYGMKEITAPICEVDLTNVPNLFKSLKLSDIGLPCGKVGLLVGTDVAHYFQG